MKTHFPLALLLSGVFLIAGCTHSSNEAGLPLSSNPVSKKTAYSSYGNYELAQLIGEWHNESMYAFIDYLRDNDLSPYTACGLSDEMIRDFMSEYMQYRFEENINLIDESFMNELIEFNIDDMWQINQELTSLVESSENYESLDNDIRCYMDELLEDCSSPQMELIYSIIGNVALKSNMLWNTEWDWQAQSLIPIELLYCLTYAEGEGGNEGGGGDGGDGNDGGSTGSENPDKPKDPNKEKQDAITQADIEGALAGAISGAIGGAISGSILGPAVVLTSAENAIVGAAIGAASASIAKAIVLDMHNVAKYVYEEDVPVIEEGSYMAQFLRDVYMQDPDRFYHLYGDKFYLFIEN